MAVMDTELKTMLKKQGVLDETIEHLRKQECSDLVLFADWVEEGKEWVAFVASAPDPTKSTAAEAPRLKAVWRRAKTIVERKEIIEKPKDWGAKTWRNRYPLTSTKIL